MAASFDISNIVKMFLDRQFPDQQALIKELRNNMETVPMKQLVAEIGHACIEFNSNPVQVLGLGVLYGMVIGVYAERDRELRSKRRT
jgi:hypothetical protein